MKIGMLWFDNDPKTELGLKIERAASYYRSKYGCNPTLCYVHPSMLAACDNITNTSPATEPASTLKAGGVEIRQNRSVLPNHFWIGVNGINTP